MESPVETRRSRLVLAGIGVFVLAALVVASVMAATNGTRALDRATPEGTAQAYFEAVLDGDESSALSLMTAELRDRCGREFPRFLPDPARILLESSDVEDDRAVVVVEIDEVADPRLFDLDGFSYRQRLVMERRDGVWRISEPPWPYFCPEGS